MLDMYKNLTGEDLRKAAKIWSWLYSDERNILWNGYKLRQIRLVDRTGRARHVFDPQEDYYIRQDFEIDPEDHLEASFGEREDSQFYHVSKANLQRLYDQAY